MPPTHDRRQFLKTAAAVSTGLPLATSTAAAVDNATQSPTELTIGIATLGFSGLTNTRTCTARRSCRLKPALLVLGLLVLSSVGRLGRDAHGRTHLPDAFSAGQLLWEIELGSHQYTIPRIDRGRVFIGVNDLAIEHPAVKSTGGGILMCLDQATGKQIWQLPTPRNMEGTRAPFHFNHWKCGVCSSPAIDGNRLYIVGPRGDVLCLDREGQRNGNDGPFLDDARYIGVPEDSGYELTEHDGDIVWQFNMITQCGVVPHDVCGSCPVLLGDHLYVCTSNGVNDRHNKVANPGAPSLIALDKHTGRLVARDGTNISQHTLHGQWSSPVAAQIRGEWVILYGGGDGVLYAFEPVDSSRSESGVQTLEVAWSYDCVPKDYREKDGERIPYSRWNRNRSDGPSEIIATPLVYRDRVYVAIGQSPLHGPGRGVLVCIDGASGRKVWDTRAVDRSLSNATAHDGLLYISDYSGQLHCLDAETGQMIWVHELGAGVWTSSPVVVNDTILSSTEKQVLWILKAGRQKEVLARSRTNSMAITPVFQDGVLYLPTQRRLFAVKVD
jgi:outer membrane protein assembly factor BamB